MQMNCLRFMRRISLCILLLLICPVAFADYQLKSSDVRVDSTQFSQNLSVNENDVQKALNALDTLEPDLSDYFTASQIVDLVYPVGSIYISISSTSPATLFGGTWVAFGTGRMLVARNAADTAIDTAEETGGWLDHVHYFTASGSFGGGSSLNAYAGGTGVASGTSYDDAMYVSGGFGFGGYTAAQTDVAGHTTGLDLRPPYIVVYMFKRTA